MSFVHPLALYLTPIVVGGLALLLIWSERRRAAALVALGSPALIARLSARVNGRGRRWQRALWLAATALLMLALARPQWGEEAQRVEQQGLQLVVALDVSTSMLADDIKPSRLERARLEIADLMQRLQGDEIGLVAFASNAFVLFPLTRDYATARKFLNEAKPGVTTSIGTRLSVALEAALNSFDTDSNSQRVILVITDGEAHDEDWLADPRALDAQEAAQRVADQGVRIFTIGFGSPEGAPVPQVDVFGRVAGTKIDAQGLPVISKLDEATLQEIARIGGGTYARASASGDELDALTSALAQMQRATLGETEDIRRTERFQIFLALALAALVAASLIPESLPAARVQAAPAAPARPGAAAKVVTR